MTRVILAACTFLLAASAVGAGLGRPDVAQPERATYIPTGSPIELGLAGYAKVLCSAVFVSGRDPTEAARNSGYFLMPPDLADKPAWTVDREQKVVRMTLGDVTREAKYYGDQGCIIHQKDNPRIFFTPVPVKTALPDAASQPWPMGDAPADATLPPEIDA